jgi:hypothetical protein
MNNNSWRKRANEIISNDSASFSSCDAIRSIRGKENLTCIVLRCRLLLVSAGTHCQERVFFFKSIGQYIAVNYITFIYEYAIRLLLCSTTGQPQLRSLSWAHPNVHEIITHSSVQQQQRGVWPAPPPATSHEYSGYYPSACHVSRVLGVLSLCLPRLTSTRGIIPLPPTSHEYSGYYPSACHVSRVLGVLSIRHPRITSNRGIIHLPATYHEYSG